MHRYPSLSSFKPIFKLEVGFKATSLCTFLENSEYLLHKEVDIFNFYWREV